MARTSRHRNREWESFEDSELLKVRICDLGLAIEGSELEERVAMLYRELDSKGIPMRPKVYLGDEWFSPEGMVAIATPFYLAHPRLIELERSQMLEVEGESAEYCMKLLRHEAGHCFDHAYHFSRRPRWRALFGSPEEDYHPETYRPRPYSRGFVHNLDNWYAQSHPDEDFAETFAVYLAPGRDWAKEFAGWSGALQKLRYVERLVRESRNRRIGGVGGYLPCSADRMRATLGTFYNKRRKEHADSHPDFYDKDLRRIFNGTKADSSHAAEQFMNRHRKRIIDTVSYWTGERKVTIDSLVRKLTQRTTKLALRLGRTEAETHLEVASYLATLVTHYLFTGKFKRSV